MSFVLIFQPTAGERAEAMFGARQQVTAWAEAAEADGAFVDGSGTTHLVHRGAVCRVLRAWKHGQEADHAA